MATSIVTLLGSVPWNAVIEGTPHVVEQAGKLLKNFGKRKAVSAIAADNEPLAALVSAQAAELTILRDELSQAMQVVLDLSQTQVTLIARVKLLQVVTIAAASLSVVGIVITTWLLM